MLNRNIQFMIDDMEDWIDEYIFQEYGIKDAAWDIDKDGMIHVLDGESIKEDDDFKKEDEDIYSKYATEMTNQFIKAMDYIILDEVIRNIKRY